MTVLEFLDRVGLGPPAPVYLFCPHKGPRARNATFEPFLAERAIERFVEVFVDPTTKDLAYAAFYADETDPGDIIAEAQTFPFLAERRVVLVRNADRYEAESFSKPMLAYLESPCETTAMLLVAPHVDKRTKFYKLCEKAGQIVECPELNEREALDWVRREVEARGKTIEPVAVRELVHRAGLHLSDLNNAINVLTGYIGDAPRIGQEDVIRACADVAEEEVWALTDSIASSEIGSALAALRRLLNFGKEPDELMGMINWLLTSAYAVAIAGGKEPKISPYVATKIRPLANKLGIRKLRDAFALCTDTHFMIRSTGVDSNLALELLVVKLAAPMPRQA